MGTHEAGPIVLWDGRVDLCGVRINGTPTWAWKQRPSELLTRRQWANTGLRPAGQKPHGRLVGRRCACPYRGDLARPERTPIARVLATLDKATAARRWCPSCRQDTGYCIPWPAPGMCVDRWPLLEQPGPVTDTEVGELTSAKTTAQEARP
jgi:hypothetical protein